MKSKTKILNLLTLLGCSITYAYATFPQCTVTISTSGGASTEEVSTDKNACIRSDNKKLYTKTSEGKYEEGKFSNEIYKCFNSNIVEVSSFENNASVAYLIKCDANSCSEIAEPDLYDVGDVYLNAYDSDNTLKFQILKQPSDGEIFNLNSGSKSLKNGVILCDKEECKIIESKDGDVYLTEDKSNKIIKCTSSGCNNGEASEGYYINSAGGDKPLIKCENKQNSIECESIQAAADKHYISALDTKSLISCESESSCTIDSAPVNSYYVNSENDQLINCYSKSCQSQSGENNGYYLTYNKEDETYGVITCTGKDIDITCTIKTTSNFEGYFRNAGSTNSSYPLIECSNNKCEALKIGKDILPGYYVDVTEGNEQILVCNENSCTVDSSNAYGGSVNGNYKHAPGESLKLLINQNADEDEDEDKYSDAASSNEIGDALYYYIEVDSNKGFPSVTTNNLSTLFKVSKYYIARVITNGIKFVDAQNKVTESGTPGSETTIYTCNKTKKTCSAGKSCVVGTYLLDVENKKGYECNSKGQIIEIKDDGYYVDSSNGNSKRPVIHCVSGECVSVTSSSYYKNAGSDSSTYPLIYCNGVTCNTSTASSGYYLGVKEESENVGIIKCSSSTSCEEISSNGIKKSEHYYLNSGNDKIQSPIIKCKNKTCATSKASEGYYITNDSSILILCENAVSCTTINASVGYYNAANIDSGKKIIECTALSNINCEVKDASVGYYVAKTPNILINCIVTPCKAISVTNGIYRSATTQIISSKRDSIPDEGDEVSNLGRATTSVVYNIISCSNTGCAELTTSELLSIPVCNFNNNKCFINNKVTISTSTVSAISAGSYCTNSDRSVIYFATDTVVIDPYIIDGTTSIYTYTTTTTNCIEALDKYSENYYTVGSSIYKVADTSIVQIVSTGYYFINVESNTLINGNNIENYNDENVKLFKCNDSSCTIVDKPETITYYADVTKKIIQYNPNSDSYTFAYDKDIICIYANNKCTPRSDIKSREFCITYKGELVLVTNDIKSRETGECYKADTMNSKIYGLSQYMYAMNAFSAERIVDTAYYVVSLSTNSTATLRDFDSRNNSVRIYGCTETKCKIIEPKEDIYYYDSISQYMFRYRDGKWHSPQASGYALVSTDPNDVYVNRFSVTNNRTTIDGKVKTGYYYTIDNEMYECDQDKYQCEKIDNNGYYFTVSGEVYQCIYDSEGLEATECVKKNCLIGQYYYINSKYYYCGSGYMLNLVTDKTCEYDDRVIINYPVAFSEAYPDRIRSAVENVALINNSTAAVTNINNKYITSVSGVFTNCTYTVEEKDSEFDLVCVNNFVTVNEETKNAEICSLANLGYVECVEDENNPEKCSPSAATSRIVKGFSFILSIIVSTLFYLYI
ncbi:scaffoldin [Neocallimastix sp. 'constans']|jgi:hypothetical protein